MMDFFINEFYTWLFIILGFVAIETLFFIIFFCRIALFEDFDENNVIKNICYIILMKFWCVFVGIFLSATIVCLIYCFELIFKYVPLWVILSVIGFFSINIIIIYIIKYFKRDEK